MLTLLVEVVTQAACGQLVIVDIPALAPRRGTPSTQPMKPGLQPRNPQDSRTEHQPPLRRVAWLAQILRRILQSRQPQAQSWCSDFVSGVWSVHRAPRFGQALLKRTLRAFSGLWPSRLQPAQSCLGSPMCSRA